METNTNHSTPQQLAESLYWKFSEFDDLSKDQVKKCCNISLSLAMESCDTQMRRFYTDAKWFIKNK